MVAMSPAPAITTSGSARHHCWPSPRCRCPWCSANRRVHIQILQVRLFVGDDDIDVIGAAQTVIGHAQQAIGIRRQIDARHVRALVGDHVQKSRILMSEAVVVLTPDQGSDQQIQRRNRSAPGRLFLDFSSHFACWLNIESMTWTNAS